MLVCQGHLKDSCCGRDELPAERAQALGKRCATYLQGCTQHCAAWGEKKTSFAAQGPCYSGFHSHTYFYHPPVSVPFCKTAFPPTRHPFPPCPAAVTGSNTENQPLWATKKQAPTIFHHKVVPIFHETRDKPFTTQSAFGQHPETQSHFPKILGAKSHSCWCQALSESRVALLQKYPQCGSPACSVVCFL